MIIQGQMMILKSESRLLIVYIEYISYWRCFLTSFQFKSRYTWVLLCN